MRVQRRAFSNRPGLEDAVQFEPKIIVEPRRMMLLDDEASPLRGSTFASPLGSAVSRFLR
jgi:hypothetical protein